MEKDDRKKGENEIDIDVEVEVSEERIIEDGEILRIEMRKR